MHPNMNWVWPQSGCLPIACMPAVRYLSSKFQHRYISITPSLPCLLLPRPCAMCRFEPLKTPAVNTIPTNDRHHFLFLLVGGNWNHLMLIAMHAPRYGWSNGGIAIFHFRLFFPIPLGWMCIGISCMIVIICAISMLTNETTVLEMEQRSEKW